MPKRGGERALSEILTLDPGAKVILASGYIEEELARHYSGKGPVGFLQKPFSLASWSDTLRQAFLANPPGRGRDYPQDQML